jgi:RimJ/RimL family protein N-acetyltransferase
MQPNFNADFSAILTGNRIQLEPLQQEHYELLKSASQDEAISTYSPALKLKFDSWFNKALKQYPAYPQFSLVVKRLQDQKIIGSTRFYEMNPEHKRLAIGYTWFIPEVWGTGINTECKFLLLKFAFETLQMNRIEFFIDARNERSRAAVKKIGAKEEGILRQHIILEDGYVRDTVVYSIIKSDWADSHQAAISI